MARPKKDGTPTADTRIENAFFDVLTTTPFDKITVSAVVQAAKVNRNSFYYHFTDLDHLARSAMANLLIPEIPQLLANGFRPAAAEIDEVLEHSATETGQLHRIPTIMGPHSTTTLRNMLKDAIIRLWLTVFRLAPEDFDAQTEATVHFALGGMLELFSDIPPDADILEALRRFRRLPIVEATAQIAMETLTAASRRAAERRDGTAS